VCDAQLTGTLPECIATMPWLSSFKVENNYQVQHFRLQDPCYHPHAVPLVQQQPAA